MWSANVVTGNELSISSITATELAAEFGTPAFIMDEADFRARATRWNTALSKAFGEEAGTVYYAAKAFICVETARWIKDVGIGIDVCTGGELAVALAGGIDPFALHPFHAEPSRSGNLRRHEIVFRLSADHNQAALQRRRMFFGIGK